MPTSSGAASIALQISPDYIWATRQALNTISDPWTLLLVVLATLLSLFMGMIPGLGGVVALSLLIPLTFGMDPLLAFAVLSAATGGANFGGSVTSILINTPGKTGNAATLLDGYPMSRDGRAEEALGASATASAFGSFAGVTVTILSIPVMMFLVGLFGPPEIFWLALWGLAVVSVIVKGDVIGGLISASFGVIFAMHGATELTGIVRWDYGLLWMRDGMQFVPAVIGLFAVSEMIKLLAEGGSIATEDSTISDDEGGSDGEGNSDGERRTRWDGMRAVFKEKEVFVRSAFIGGFIGIIPGIGSSAANFIAYFHAVKTTRNPQAYGTGDVRGVIAPEASNDAKDGTSFIPTLAFGVPGSSSMAVLLGAFILHGIDPGPQFFEQNLDIIAVIIIAFVISNFLTSAIGLLGAEHLYKITELDIRYLAPFVITVAFFGAYAVNNNIYATVIMIFFGLLGYLFIKAEISRIPMILGMVLAPLIERNFFNAWRMSLGDPAIFVRSFTAIFLIGLIIVSLGLPWFKKGFQKLQGTMTDEESVTVDEDIKEAAEEAEEFEEKRKEKKLYPGSHWHYQLLFYVFMLGWATYMLAEVFTYDSFEDWFFPAFFLPAAIVLLSAYIFKHVYPEIWYRFLPEEGESRMESLFKGTSDRTLYEEQKIETVLFGWVILLAAGAFYLGMGLFLPIWLFAFLYYFTRNLTHSLVLTVVVIGFLWLLFIEILNMIIWTGRWQVLNPTEIINEFLVQLRN